MLTPQQEPLEEASAPRFHVLKDLVPQMPEGVLRQFSIAALNDQGRQI